ncbi:c-type cytochrome [uncultured Sulfitobacter sp.]|uniref:c-type cytochrome n=1 Tax=uncultured Sulfitobacter sp. TaxID=191468 RepID=UPI002618F882|nr:c-type cytochrome [uncultured Sulfitobacter sp.]
MIRSLAALTLSTLAISACTASLAPSPKASGAYLFDKHCTSCHGRTAEGDGPLASGFAIPPANLTLIAQRNGGTFPTAGVMAQINGYTGRHQLGGMPEFEEVIQSPLVDWASPSGEVIPTPQSLLALATYLESIQQ